MVEDFVDARRGVRIGEVLASNEEANLDQIPGFERVANSVDISGSYSDRQFYKELAEISLRYNQFFDIYSTITSIFRGS